MKNLLLCCAINCMVAVPNIARSETATYAINSSDSQIRIVPSTFGPLDPDLGADPVIAGSTFLGIFGIKEQKLDSLECQISGMLTANVNGSTLSFNGSIIDALPNLNGPFSPNIGFPGQEDNFGADVVFSVSGDVFPNGTVSLQDFMIKLVSGTAVVGNSPSGLAFSLVSGVLHRDLSFPDETESIPLAPLSPTVLNGTVETLSGDLSGTIRIPFHLEYPYAIRVPGDYSQNLLVDAADYVIWRKLNGLVGAAGEIADGSQNGSVGPEDYALWRRDFGTVNSLLAFEGEIVASRVLGSSAHSATPEPSSFGLVSLVLIAAVLRRKPLSRTHGARIFSTN